MFLAYSFAFCFLQLTQVDPCVTFDPSNELHSGHRLFGPNIVAIEPS